MKGVGLGVGCPVYGRYRDYTQILLLDLRQDPEFNKNLAHRMIWQ